MSMSLKLILKRIHHKIQLKLFNHATRHFTQLPPLTLSNHPVCLVSLMCHRDVNQYVVAVNSFCQYLLPSRIIAVDDGSLSPKDKRQLQTLIPALEILAAKQFADSRLPTGGCWERIQAIADFVKDHYVIQMDADIFSQNKIDEVIAYSQQCLPFMLGTNHETGQKINTATEISEVATGLHANGKGSHHVQVMAEINLPGLNYKPNLKYVRACAGFAGFPKNSFAIEDLCIISEYMVKTIGDKWYNWGSEQVTSNIILANQANTKILPIKFYNSADFYTPALKLIHFIGTCRFDKGIFQKLAVNYINQHKQ